MYRTATALAFLAVSALPASAGGDWYDDGYYETHHWREYRTYHRGPYRVPSYEVYIPYGAYFVDEPDAYGASCEVEREWRHGRYRERIECDDD